MTLGLFYVVWVGGRRKKQQMTLSGSTLMGVYISKWGKNLIASDTAGTLAV